MFRSLVPLLILLLVGAPAMAGEHTQDVTRVSLNGDNIVRQGEEASSNSLLDLPARLSVEEVSLPEALKALRHRSGVPIGFSPTRTADAGVVTCLCEEISVSAALTIMLAGTDFQFVELGDRILVERRTGTPRASGTDGAPLIRVATPRTQPLAHRMAVRSPAHRSAPQTGAIEGTVVEQGTARPLDGSQVQVVGTGLGALADGQGRFRIAEVPAGDVQVRVQRIGYGTQTRTVNVVAGETVSVDFQLRQEALGLDEIVVTGTAGESRRRELGHTISQFNVADVREPVMNVDHLLQGREASVDVSQTSGGIGAGAQIRLRGNVSTSQTNQPLIYIDGIRIPADQYPRGNSLGDTFHRGPNRTPSPLNDINPGDIERIEIIKGPAAATLYGTEAAAGVIQVFTKRGREGTAQWTLQVDQSANWMQEFAPGPDPYIGMDPWLQTGHGQRVHLSVGGGASDVSYFLSGGLESNTGVLVNDREERVTVRGNLGFSGFENLRVDWNTSLSIHNMENTSEGNNAQGLQFNVYRRPNNPVGSDRFEDLNEIMNQEILTSNDRFQTGVTLSWMPSDRFTHRATVGYDRLSNRFHHIAPFGFRLQPEGKISDVMWIADGISLDYVGNFGLQLTEDLRTTISWGGQYQRDGETLVDAFGRGFPGPGDHVVSNAANRTAHTSEFQVVTGGLFTQAVFDLRDRYFLTVGVRADGNSAFGDDFGIQYYPKASLSYVISDEDFWPAGWGDLRLRTAFGQAGRAPGAFDAVRTFQATGYVGIPAFVPENVGNPVLGPERTNELEVGFDASVLEDRLGVEFTYYHQDTKDALFTVTQIPSLGFLGGQLENVGGLTNRGMELSLNARVLQSPDFYWDLGGSVATNRSEITDTGPATVYTLVEGQPAPVVRGTRVLNPDALAAPEVELDAFFGPNQPTHILRGTTAIGLPRGIEVSFIAEYQGGHYISDGASYNMVDRGNGAPGCHEVYNIVAYSDPDPNANPGMSQIPALYRLRCYRQNLISGSWIYPADFFKLRAATLTVPLGELLPRTTSATLTLSGRNLWRSTNKDFWTFDPEMSGRELDSLTRNISEQIPAPASFTASIRIGF
jgi:TonB-dependent starch-binding outer membrane protein SusC